MGEFLGLVVLGLFLVGPDRLPSAARDFARILHKIRNFTTYASNELKENLGPGFENLEVTDLNPKKLAKKLIDDAMEQTGDAKPLAAEAKKQVNELKDIAKIDPDLL